MDRFLKIGACLMTALLATGAAAATVDLAADGTLDLMTDDVSGHGAGGVNVNVDDEGASADAAGGASVDNEHASGSADGGANADVSKPDVPEPEGSASAVGDVKGKLGW